MNKNFRVLNSEIFFYFLFVLCSISCSKFGNEEKQNQVAYDRCECPLNVGDIRHEIDSTRNLYITEKGGGGDVNISGDIFRDFLNSEIFAVYSNREIRYNSETVIRNIIDNYPKITDYEMFKKEYYCAYINIVCRDSTVSDHEMIKIKLSSLRELEKLVDNIFSKEFQSNSSRSFVQKRNSYWIQSKLLSDRDINLINEEIKKNNLFQSSKSPDFLIEIILSEGFELVPFSGSHYVYNSLFLKILVNGKTCRQMSIFDTFPELINLEGTRIKLRDKAINLLKANRNLIVDFSIKNLTTCIE